MKVKWKKWKYYSKRIWKFEDDMKRKKIKFDIINNVLYGTLHVTKQVFITMEQCCVCACVCVCVCVCLYSSACWFLPAARRLWHKWEVIVKVIDKGYTYKYHQGLDGAAFRNYARLFCWWHLEHGWSGLFFKALADTGLAKKLKNVKAVRNQKSEALWHFFCPRVDSRYVNLLLLELVKFHDALENHLILLNCMVCSIFTAKKHGWQKKSWFRFLPP